ncbi:MAG: hypothetical protein AAFZ05_14560, partial [Pseudomonadota bacterium]
MVDHVVATTASGPRPPPVRQTGTIGWLRENLFNTFGNAVTTIAIIAFLVYVIPGFLNWALFDAVFKVDSAACRGAEGACWGMVGEKWRVMLFGRYPFGEQWRSVVAMVLLVGLIGWSINPNRWGRALSVAWCFGIPAILILMGGSLSYFQLPFLIAGAMLIAGLSSQLIASVVGAVVIATFVPTVVWAIDSALGGGVLPAISLPRLPDLLTPVDTSLWGGLPLTFILATVGIALSFPLAVALALGRQSDLPAIRAICIGFIELIRGVPLITILFMA